eukprot:6129906-Lingulodinium_polyedra.AAC.1
MALRSGNKQHPTQGPNCVQKGARQHMIITRLQRPTRGRPRYARRVATRLCNIHHTCKRKDDELQWAKR